MRHFLFLGYFFSDMIMQDVKLWEYENKILNY